MLSKRVQVLLDEKEYKKIKAIGKGAHKSVGEIFREAVSLYGERLGNKFQRMELVDKMLKLNAPISDWPAMEKSILRARSK